MKLLMKLLKGKKRKELERLIKMSSTEQKKKIRKILKENNDKTAKDYSDKKEKGDINVSKWEKEIQRITKKMMLRKNLNDRERDLLDMHKAYFTRTHDIRTAQNKVNSSWILRVRYLKKSETLFVRMIRGTMDYPFYNVPFWVWAFLTTLPSHAGKYWWDKALGIRFSSNPENWIRKPK